MFLSVIETYLHSFFNFFYFQPLYDYSLPVPTVIAQTALKLTVTHAALNPVIFYAAISNFLVLRERAEQGPIFGSYQLGCVK